MDLRRYSKRSTHSTRLRNCEREKRKREKICFDKELMITPCSIKKSKTPTILIKKSESIINTSYAAIDQICLPSIHSLSPKSFELQSPFSLNPEKPFKFPVISAFLPPFRSRSTFLGKLKNRVNPKQ